MNDWYESVSHFHLDHNIRTTSEIPNARRKGHESAAAALSAKKRELKSASATLSATRNKHETITADVNKKQQELETITVAVNEKQQELETITATVNEKQQELETITVAVNKKQQQFETITVAVNEKQQEFETSYSASNSTWDKNDVTLLAFNVFNVIKDYIPNNKADHVADSDLVALTGQIAKLSDTLQSMLELAGLKNSQPMFRHPNSMLMMAAEVQERYWGDNWDPTDPSTNPRQNVIIERIKCDPRCGSFKRAEMVATMANPNN